MCGARLNLPELIEPSHQYTLVTVCRRTTTASTDTEQVNGVQGASAVPLNM